MSAEIVVLVVVLSVLAAAALLAAYLTAHRLDRLHIRTDLARSALVGALDRRRSVAASVGRAIEDDHPEAARRVDDAVAVARRHPPESIAGTDPAPEPDMRRWRTADGPPVEQAENDLGMVLINVDRDRLPADLGAELEDVLDRVSMARHFYNDAVRDTRGLREQFVVRVLRLAGRAPMPDYVELVDPPPPGT